jgi:membrane protein
MIGAITFSLLWIAAKFLFVTYSTYATVYANLYGSLLEIVLLLLWIYYSSALLLIGAEVAHRLQERAQVWAEVTPKPTQSEQALPNSPPT